MVFFNQSLEKIDSKLLKLVPKGVALRYCAIPVSRKGKALLTAMADCDNRQHCEDLKNMTGFEIHTLTSIRRKEVVNAIIRHYELTEDEETDLRTKWGNSENKPSDSLVSSLENNNVEDSNLSLVLDEPFTEEGEDTAKSLFTEFINRAFKNQYEQVIVDIKQSECILSYRKFGILFPERRLSSSGGETLSVFLRETAGMSPQNYGRPERTEINFKTGDDEVKAGILSIPTASGEQFVINMPLTVEMPESLEELNMPKESIKHLLRSSGKRRGLIIFSGPRGSQYLLTLRTFLKVFPRKCREIHVIDGEDRFPENGIYFTTIKQNHHFSFKEYYESGLYRVPDILTVINPNFDHFDGTLLKASRERLVLAAFESKDAAESLTMTACAPHSDHIFYEIPITICSQTVLRTLCKFCRQSVEVKPRILKALNLPTDASSSRKFYRSTPDGCEKCRGTGYSGYVILYQFLPVDENLKEMVINGASPSAVRAFIRKSGVPDFRETALQHFLSRVTSLHEVLRVS